MIEDSMLDLTLEMSEEDIEIDQQLSEIMKIKERLIRCGDLNENDFEQLRQVDAIFDPFEDELDLRQTRI